MHTFVNNETGQSIRFLLAIDYCLTFTTVVSGSTQGEGCPLALLITYLVQWYTTHDSDTYFILPGVAGGCGAVRPEISYS